MEHSLQCGETMYALKQAGKSPTIECGKSRKDSWLDVIKKGVSSCEYSSSIDNRFIIDLKKLIRNIVERIEFTCSDPKSHSVVKHRAI